MEAEKWCKKDYGYGRGEGSHVITLFPMVFLLLVWCGIFAIFYLVAICPLYWLFVHDSNIKPLTIRFVYFASKLDIYTSIYAIRKMLIQSSLPIQTLRTHHVGMRYLLHNILIRDQWLYHLLCVTNNLFTCSITA